MSMSNKATIAGEVVELNETTKGKYKARLMNYRANGKTDVIDFVFRTSAVAEHRIVKIGDFIELTGALVTRHSGNSHINYILVKHIDIIDDKHKQEALKVKNEIYIFGTITNEVGIKQVGEKIRCSSIIEAENTNSVPFVSWNAIAQKMGELGLTVGDKVALYGRLQQRIYRKKAEGSSYEKVITELVVSSFKKL